MPRVTIADPEDDFLKHLRLIEQIAIYIARKQHLRDTDGEDFVAHVRYEFIKDNYARLRNYRGDSSLRTYLTAVIAHLCLDYQTARWGKFRNSAIARREGPVAMLLETLLVRDGLPVGEAVETIWTNHRIEVTRAELNRLLALLPVRTPRHVVGEEGLVHLPSAAPAPDQGVTDAADVLIQEQAKAAFKTAMATLTAQDCLILCLVYADGFTVANVARQLGLAQAPLYRRLEQLLKRLCASFREADLDDATVLPLLGKWTVEFDWPDQDVKDDRPVRPPNQQSEEGDDDDEH